LRLQRAWPDGREDRYANTVKVGDIGNAGHSYLWEELCSFCKVVSGSNTRCVPSRYLTFGSIFIALIFSFLFDKDYIYCAFILNDFSVHRTYMYVHLSSILWKKEIAFNKIMMAYNWTDQYDIF